MRPPPTPRKPAAPERTGHRLLRLVVAVVLGFSGLVLVEPSTAAAAGSILLQKTSSGAVLVGGEVTYHLTASNPGASGVEQYNLSFNDVLPVGATYVAGSTSPATYGEPAVITIVDDASVTPNVTHQVLVWENVSDVGAGAQRTLDFRARVDPDLYPVGATVDNTASAFTSSDVREVPAFDAQGQPTPGSEVVSSTDSTSTEVTAVSIAKSEGSPEGELLRGVNDHQTVYSLKVTNNVVDATSSLVVTDYLSAGLEFLGCGGPFNGDDLEYPGAANVVADVTGCTDPTTVDTVADPPGYPAGVYTRVTWVLPDLTPGDTFTIRYAAGIPQRENTMRFIGGDNGDQTANLNNNHGRSTRETLTEQSLGNYAVVDGEFQGAPVTDHTDHSVTAEDLRLVKTVKPGTFTQGQLATYTLTIDTSEYTNSSGLVVTDVMPDGLCPMGTSDPFYVPTAECDPTQGANPTNASITRVVPNADGSFTLTFTPDAAALAANSKLVITYQARMQQNYDVIGGPTSARDTFTNTATATATTEPAANVDAPDPSGPEKVSDTSSASIASGGPTLTKLRMRNTTPMQCSNDPADYAKDYANEDPFTEGDRVCFLLEVRFPAGVDTRNSQLTDFLPTNLTYESSSELSPGGQVADVQPANPASDVTWLLGTGNPRVVPKDTVVRIQLSAVVTRPAPLDGSTPKALGKDNLAKFRYANTGGQSESLRDAVSLPIGPPPPVGITKGVQAINGTAIDTGSTPGNVDGSTVRADDRVTFRIDVQNLANPGELNADTVSAPDVWDVLPAGITCAAVSAISDAGACFDAGAPGRPGLSSGNATASVIRWQLPASWTLAPQAHRTLSYSMQIPSDVSVGVRFDNEAAVAAYATGTNIDDGGTRPVAIHNPENNVNAAVLPANMDVPEARDTSWVITPSKVVTKSNVTDITEIGNSAAQAVVGETLTYTIGVTIPASTSVYNGVLSDPLPAGVVFVGPASAAYSATGSSPATGALPPGVTLDPASGTLRFGTAYANTSTSDQLFEVKIPSRIGTDPANVNGVVLTNTATVTSDTAASGGTPITPRIATSTVTVVTPAPALTKSVNPATVAGGDTVTYTLRATNASRRPPLHDAWVVDCLPQTMTFGTFTTVPAGTTAPAPVPGDGSNGCAVGFTRIAWELGTLPGIGSRVALVYTAIVNSSPVGRDQYTNTATLRGSTLDDGKTDPVAPDNTLEQVLTATSSASVTVGGATIAKSSHQTTMTIGEVGTFTLTVTIPKNTAFYDSAVIDTIPTGMSYVAGSSTTSCENADSSACSVPGTELTPRGNVVGWLVGDLAASAQVRTVTIHYGARLNDVPANVAGVTRTNTARYSWNKVDGADPTSAGSSWAANSNNATSAVRVVEPGLTVAKKVDDSTVEPGQTFGYELTVANDGRTDANLSEAYNITVTDTVPTGVVVDPATIVPAGALSNTDGNGSGGTITWTLPGPFAAQTSTTFTYSARLAPSGTLTSAGLTNTAAVTHYESLPSGGRTNYPPTSAPATVTPQFPAVVPTKAAAPGPAYLGKPKAWTVTLTNTGGAPARSVDVVDTLPQNWTYDAGSAVVVIAGSSVGQRDPGISVDGSGRQVLTWDNLGTVPAGANNTLVITFTATPKDPDAASVPGVGAGVPHTNTVSAVVEDATGATGNANGPYTSGPATASTHIDAADVQLRKTAGAAVAGRNLAYTLTVTNNGPDRAVGPFPVVDTLPTGVGSVTASGSGWTCSVAATTVSCSRSNAADTLATGASFPAITVTVAVPADAATGTMLTNSASVGSATFDPELANNTDLVNSTITRSVDLGIVKHTSGTITPGLDATYTLDVTNHGPSDSTGPVTVTDSLPGVVSFVSAGGIGWSCAEASGTVTCTRPGGLAFGEAAPQIAVVVHVPAGQTADLTNTATVAGPEADPKPANNTSTVRDPVHPAADLELTKVHQGTFVAGSTGTYHFTVTNNGPSVAAPAIRVVDQLEPELTFLSDDSPDWSCSATAGGLLTCTRASSLAVGETSEFGISVGIDSAHVGDVVNTATVSSPTDDPHLPNNTADDSTGVSLQADLGIVKSHTGTATAGEDLAFTLEVTNHGSSDSPAPITVSDSLPPGMTYVSASGGWNCSATGRVVTCTSASALPANNSSTITLNVHVAPDAGPAFRLNWASVDGTIVDPNPDNNTDFDIVAVRDRANVRITKTANPTDAVAGGPVTYTLTVANDGPSDADNVQVSDALPPGMEYVGIDSDPGVTCADANPIDCQLSTMPAGSSTQIEVRARVGSGVAPATQITNLATVSTSTPGDNLADNTDSATIRVDTAADLGIVKSHPAGPVVAGQQVTFDLAVHNAGPSDAAADVVVTDTLPDGMTYLGNTGPWTCVASGHTVTCTLDGSAAVVAGSDAPSLSVTAQIDADLDPADLVGGTLANTAHVSSGTPDPHPDNNSDTDRVRVQFEADLSITKSHTGPVRVGDPLVFTLQVANAGPSTARQVTVTDALPAGLQLDSASGTGWTCTDVGQDLTCDLAGPLIASASAPEITVTVKVLASAYPGVTNTATVSATTTDPVPDNNRATDPVTVPPLVDLGITKSHTPQPMQVGDRATYSIGVSNAGSTDDPGPLTVTDALPAGLTFVSGSGDGWACVAVGQDVTCARTAGLATTGNTAFDIVVQVGPDAYPGVINTAVVSSRAEDPNPDNNTATDPGTVLPLYRLGLRKTLASSTSSRASWTLTVTNNGPNVAPSGVTVIDDLPSQLTYLGFDGDGWTCAAAGQQVTCDYGQQLAVDESVSVVLHTAIDPDATGTIVNSATINGGIVAEAHLTVPRGGDLAFTGGVGVGLGVVGLACLGAGILLVRRRRLG